MKPKTHFMTDSERNSEPVDRSCSPEDVDTDTPDASEKGHTTKKKMVNTHVCPMEGPLSDVPDQIDIEDIGPPFPDGCHFITVNLNGLRIERALVTREIETGDVSVHTDCVGIRLDPEIEDALGAKIGKMLGWDCHA
jgi:hypothetical protein